MVLNENAASVRHKRSLRLLTYNVHRCLGTDDVLSPQRIADVIAACEPDIVALQELDVNRPRTGGIDQAVVIANALRMSAHFHPAIQVMEEQYGDAILTALPSRVVRGGRLPGVTWMPRLEPRGAIWASIDVGGITLNVLNTHLGLLAPEQLLQARALLGRDWLGHHECRGPVIMLGDFNAIPGSRTHGEFVRRMTDAQDAVRLRAPTFPARTPFLRIDHVFVGGPIKVKAISVPRFAAALVASDHRPLVVDLDVWADDGT